MKIIRRGIPEIQQVPSWIGHIFICSFCNSEFQLEEGDKVREIPEGLGFNLHPPMISFDCPCCFRNLKFKQK